MKSLIKWNLCLLMGVLWAGLVRPLLAASVLDSPPWLTNVVSGSNLILSWPSDHIGWMLEVQTNAPGVGITRNWNTITDSTTTNLWTLPINPANGSVLSRLVYQTGSLFSDDFTRGTDPGPLTPWVVANGVWEVTGGELLGGTNALGGSNAAGSYADAYITNTWTDYTVQASIQFPAGGFGGGLGGRLNPINGAHYAAWIYPEGSSGGSAVVKLIKFQDWTDFSYNGTANSPMAQASLPSVGTTWHTLALAFKGNQISVSYDGTNYIATTDGEAVPYLEWRRQPRHVDVHQLLHYGGG